MKNNTFIVKITDNYGKGWFFTITNRDHYGYIKLTKYRTNRLGQGLFKIEDNGNEFQQMGTCQFSLSENRETARKQIREYFKMYLG